MRSLSRTRLPLALAALAAASAIVLGVASGAENQAAQRPPRTPNLLLGVTGRRRALQGPDGPGVERRPGVPRLGPGPDLRRAVRGALPLARPDPDAPPRHGRRHPRTARRRSRRQQIAQGKGDSYLIALNHAIASWGKAIYVRPHGRDEQLQHVLRRLQRERDAARTPTTRRRATAQAFARIYVILHGGTIDAGQREAAEARAAGRAGHGAASRTRSRSCASSGARSRSRCRRSPATRRCNYYPGNAYVDVDGRRHLRRELHRAVGRPRGALHRGAQAREAVLDPRVRA